MSDSLPESLSPSAVERIDEVCDRFEAAWKGGGTPRVGDYLDGESGPERDALLQELLRVEAHYRRRVEAPTLAGGTVGPPRDVPLVAGYNVLGELGRGGMGVVYKARQLRPNRLVALKMILAGASAGPRELERFLREADAVAHLQHPHIVQVYEVGEHNGLPYFALEYVAGGSLDKHLVGTPQPPRAAAQFVEQLAHAIHHAHQRGIVHRDLKPANILLVSGGVVSGGAVSGGVSPGTHPELTAHQPTFHHSPLTTHQPKITDFGLAKLMEAGPAGPTRSGDVLGTPSYMAPEQVAGGSEPVSAATDVYGLGAILYELLTGRPPFRAESPLETMFQVRTVEPVAPSRLQPKCPRELATICLKCLAKPPGQRYAGALDLAEDLRRFLDGQPIRARPVGPLQQLVKWTRRQPVVAGLAGLLVLAVTLGVGAGSWFWWQAEKGLKTAENALNKEHAAQAERAATLDRYRVALAHREWLANNAGHAEALLDACTPKHKESWEWRYLDRMRRSALATFAGHDNTIQSLAINPLIPQIATASHDGTVRVWDLDTGHGRIALKHPFAALAVAYSPDGRLLASAGRRDGVIRFWSTKSGAAQRAMPFGSKAMEDITIWALAFHPSNRYLAVGGPRRVKVWDLHERIWAYDQVVAGGAVTQVAFSPDGRYLATAMDTVRLWDWSAKAKKPTYEWPGHASGTHDLAFSPDGAWLASGGRDCLIRLHNLETKREEFALHAHQLAVTKVHFSPDGQRLVSAGQDGDMHVWSVKERRRLHTLHGHSGAVWDVAFASDGKRLVSAGADALVRVWDAAANQEVVTLPVPIPTEVTALDYGPGGLLAWGDLDGRAGVWDTVRAVEVCRLDKTRPKGRGRIGACIFAPDGRQVVWRRSGQPTLWDLETANEIALVDAGQVPILGLAFSADSTQLLAAAWEDGVLQVRDLRSGLKTLTLPWPDKTVTRVVWSPDARLFVTLEDKRFARVWDAATGRTRGQLEHDASITHVAFSADSRFFAIGGIGGGLRVWDVTTNGQTMAAAGQGSNLHGLALSPDGQRLAAASADSTARLWDTATGHEVLTLRTQLHEHSPLAFSPDGTAIASVNVDNGIQIWSTRSASQPEKLE